MATIINKYVGKLSKEYIDFTSGKLVNQHNSYYGVLNKAWRALLLVRQQTSKNKAVFDNKKADAEQQHPAIPGGIVPGGRTNKAVIDWANRHKDIQLVGLEENNTNGIQTPSFSLSKRMESRAEVRNTITIINYCTSPYQSIVIQGMPQQIEVEPTTDWVAVKSMGRNNPFMMYTGGEDVIKFDISWYVHRDTTRTEVIKKCKLLESWTRADGYISAPPTLKIKWGNTGLYDNDTFVLTSANYILKEFQNAYFHPTDLSGNGKVVDLKLLPHCATQELVFKRVTPGNRRHIDIISEEELASMRPLPEMSINVTDTISRPNPIIQ